MSLCREVLEKPLIPWELHYQKDREAVKSVFKVSFYHIDISSRHYFSKHVMCRASRRKTGLLNQSLNYSFFLQSCDQS